MSDLIFLVPRQDFMHQSAYDVLDAVLTSSGFFDEGVTSISEHAFRQYFISASQLESIPPLFSDSIEDRRGGEVITLYSKTPLGEMDAAKLSCYGLFFSGISNLSPDVMMWQYAIDMKNMSRFARMAPNGIRASRRYIEESSYYNWIENGYRVGHDLADWFAAEWSADERIQMYLKAME